MTLVDLLKYYEEKGCTNNQENVNIEYCNVWSHNNFTIPTEFISPRKHFPLFGGVRHNDFDIDTPNCDFSKHKGDFRRHTKIGRQKIHQ